MASGKSRRKPRKRATARHDADEARQLTLTVRGTRRTAEAIALEVRQLAERLGVPVEAVRIRRVDRRAMVSRPG